MKISDTHSFLKQPPILQTPPFSWEKSESPSFSSKILKTQPPPAPFIKGRLPTVQTLHFYLGANLIKVYFQNYMKNISNIRWYLITYYFCTFDCKMSDTMFCVV